MVSLEQVASAYQDRRKVGSKSWKKHRRSQSLPNSSSGRVLFVVCGCASSYNLTARVAEIEQKHNVVIKADNSLYQGCLSELLGVIEKDLERCPQHFKDNIGPIFVENSFSEIGSKGMFLAGYVDTADMWNRYPIYIKNRSVLEKVLLFMPREDEVFLHEASHSFELNIKA